jgi:hypothetical protein
MTRYLLASLLAFSAACGGVAAGVFPEDSGAGEDGPRGFDSGADARPDAPGAMGSLTCPYGLGDSSDVLYDKSCTAPGDCTFGLHYLDCCGTQVALGINARDAPAFDLDAGGICHGAGAMCQCLDRGVYAEDGQRITANGAFGEIVVSCIAGSCVTSIRDAH